MPKRMFAKISDEQEAMLPLYREKWRSIAMLTESIEPERVAAVIKASYLLTDYSEPEILFFSNPMIAVEKILAVENFKAYLGRNIHIKYLKRVVDHIQSGIRQQLGENLFIRLRNQIQFPEFPYYSTENHPQVSYFPYTTIRCIEAQIIAALYKHEIEYTDILYFTNVMNRPVELAIWGCRFDFCISVLDLHHDQKKWKAHQELISSCGLLFRFEKVCLACDRPCKLSFDQDNLLHAEGTPALQFADGYSVYAEHGRHPSEEE